MIHYINADGITSAWVGAEIEIIERQGVPFKLHAMRKGASHFYGSAWARRLDENTNRIYPLPWGATARDILLAPFRYRGRFFSALGNALFGHRESWRARLACIAHLFVACHWATTLPRDNVSLVHSQWIHSCGTIGMYGAWLLGVPFSFTGHAADLFRNRVALRDKVRRADFIVCISSFHRDLYLKLGASPDKLHTIYCGIDVSKFAYRPRPRGNETPVILSVGRLVEKKGFDYLIDACGILRDRGTAVRCIIAGDGPLDRPLREQIVRRQLQATVEVTGKALLQEELPDFLVQGHVFAQPCVWAKDDDVDGTPRTLMEAMACGNAVVSTRLVGIPDIVEDGQSGLLVAPNDAEQLADAIQRLIDDPAMASRLAAAGRRRMEDHFQIDRCVAKLAALFRTRIEASGAPMNAVNVPA